MQKGFLIFCLSCTGLEKAEKEKLRERNMKGEYIYRHEKEVFYSVPPPKPRPKEPYPWEQKGAKP